MTDEKARSFVVTGEGLLRCPCCSQIACARCTIQNGGVVVTHPVEVFLRQSEAREPAGLAVTCSVHWRPAEEFLRGWILRRLIPEISEHLRRLDPPIGVVEQVWGAIVDLDPVETRDPKEGRRRLKIARRILRHRPGVLVAITEFARGRARIERVVREFVELRRESVEKAEQGWSG